MLSPELAGTIGILFLFVFILFGIPIAISSTAVGFLGCWFLIGLDPALGVVYTIPIAKVATYSLSVIPLFILMGVFAVEGGIGKEIYSACVTWLGSKPGGLGMATCAASGLFGACSGSSLAATATFTKLSLPEMQRYKYDKRFSTGIIAASGSFAAMIPPSGMMVIFCTFSDVSLGKMLIGGVFPGILSVVVYMTSIHLRAKMNPKLGPTAETNFSWKEKIDSLKYLSTAIMTFFVLLGGIYFGFFSPTEAGAAGAFFIFLVVLIRGRFTRKNFINSFVEATTTSAMIFFIIIGAMIFAQFLAISRLPNYFAQLVLTSSLNASILVIFILLIYIILGTFLDAVAMMALTLPILYPIVEAIGINGIWFGIMVIKMTEIALITPPLGLNVYVVKGMAPEGTTLEDVFLGILPFIFLDVITLAIIFIFPSIATWLPATMG